LHELKKRLAHFGTTVCMHGTDDLKDPLFRECIEAGASKININSWTRDPYLKELQEGIANGNPLPQTIDKATAAFGKEAIRHYKLYGSAGKA
jgi:fructose-bisphosphate aldolase class II